jgi:hypothetical protein
MGNRLSSAQSAASRRVKTPKTTCSGACRARRWRQKRQWGTEQMRATLQEALALNAAERLAIETALERLGP